MGGLGNQMFVWAFALALRSRGHEVKMDLGWHQRHRAHNGWELDRVFGIACEEANQSEIASLGDLDDGLGPRLRRRILGPKRSHFQERGPGFDPRWAAVDGDRYFDGYWQSPLYHRGLESEIEAVFAFSAGLETEAQALLDRGRPLVGLHIRRGDYVGSSSHGSVCDEIYYRDALLLLTEGLDRPLVLFFSDDLEWCRAHYAGEYEAVYVDWNRGEEAWKDMRLMTHCERLAIANSSFSWWGARLGDSGRTIIAPSRWYGVGHADNADIALPNWKRMPAGREA